MFAFAFAPLALSACAVAEMHSEDQLNSVARSCGLSFGEVMQDASEKRLLFLMRALPSPQQRACVYDWAHRNHLHLVLINLVNEPAS